MLQQIIRSIAKTIFGHVSESHSELRASINAVDTKTTELRTHVSSQVWPDILDKERRIVANALQIQAVDTAMQRSIDATTQLIHNKINTVDAKINGFAGLIDDTNLDSIREIADRIKAEAQGTQSLRVETQAAYHFLNGKFDSLMPAEMQNKTAAEWDDLIAGIVAEEAANLR